MIQRVVPLAKLLPTAHFPFYEDLSRIPGRPSGLFAEIVHWTISFPLSTTGKGLTYRPIGLQIRLFRTCET